MYRVFLLLPLTLDFKSSTTQQQRQQQQQQQQRQQQQPTKQHWEDHMGEISTFAKELHLKELSE